MRQQLKLGDSETERKLTGTNILPAVRGTKGLSKSGKGLAGCRLAQPCRRQEAGGRRQEAEGRRQEAGGRGEGKGANSAPETASPTTLQTGL